MNKNILRDWNIFMTKVQKQKDMIEYLSKLYIIIHQNVSKMMRECTLNLKYDAKPDAQKHLEFIKEILLKLNERNTDQYLSDVNKNIIQKFQQQIFDLVYQIQKTLEIQDIVSKLDLKKLMRIQHSKTKQKHTLKDQLKQSQKRRVRSKSGHNKVYNRKEDVNQNQYNELIPEADKHLEANLLSDIKMYKTLYLKKKKHVEKELANHVEKRGNQVIFSNKYANRNLENYFQDRTELMALFFSDQFEKAIFENKNHDDIESNLVEMQKNKKQNIENKLFNEFKIKTKSMKKKVKENILNVLVDVKKELLAQYHNSNIEKLKQGNPETMIKLNSPKKRSQIKIRSYSQKMFQNVKTEKRTASTFVKTQPNFKYMMAHESKKPKVYDGSVWNKKIEQDECKKMLNKILYAKIPREIK